MPFTGPLTEIHTEVSTVTFKSPLLLLKMVLSNLPLHEIDHQTSSEQKHIRFPQAIRQNLHLRTEIEVSLPLLRLLSPQITSVQSALPYTNTLEQSMSSFPQATRSCMPKHPRLNHRLQIHPANLQTGSIQSALHQIDHQTSSEQKHIRLYTSKSPTPLLASLPSCFTQIRLLALFSSCFASDLSRLKTLSTALLCINSIIKDPSKLKHISFFNKQSPLFSSHAAFVGCVPNTLACFAVELFDLAWLRYQRCFSAIPSLPSALLSGLLCPLALLCFAVMSPCILSFHLAGLRFELLSILSIIKTDINPIWTRISWISVNLFHPTSNPSCFTSTCSFSTSLDLA